MRHDLTRDQQKLAHAFGGLRYLANPDTIKPEWGGGTLRLSLSTGDTRWIEYDTRSIRALSDLGGKTLARVTWDDLRAHAHSLSPALVDELQDHQRRATAHARAFRSYPNRHADPEGWAEVERWHRETHRPEGRALDAEGKALRDRCYPLAVSNEPVDLLDLLNSTNSHC